MRRKSPYDLTERDLHEAILAAAARAKRNPSHENNLDLHYLIGVDEARHDGVKPPFKEGQFVTAKKQRPTYLQRGVQQVRRMHYFGKGVWRIELRGDRHSHKPTRYVRTTLPRRHSWPKVQLTTPASEPTQHYSVSAQEIESS